MRQLAWQNFSTALSDYPLIAAGLFLVFLIILLLGTLHAIRLFLRVAIVLLDEAQHELSGMRALLRRLKEQWRTWKADP